MWNSGRINNKCCCRDAPTTTGSNDNMEYTGGWTEVHSKKTQQKMKALSRQSSANKLVGPFSANPQSSNKKRQSAGKLDVNQGSTGKHSRHSSKLKNAADNVHNSMPAKSLKKSYSQALSHEGKDGSSNASLPRPELSAQTSKETIIVSEVCLYPFVYE